MNGISIIEELPAGTVPGEIEFLRPTKERPFSYDYEPSRREPPATATFTVHHLEIRNARKRPTPLSLAEHGAALVDYPSGVRDFYTDEQLLGVYYPESAAVIQALTGADRVIVFDHNVRRGQSLSADGHNQGRPVLHAHTDYTEVSAMRRLRECLGPRAKDLQPARVLQINLWRPIRGPLRDFPLAICDASSIDSSQLKPVDLLYRDRRGEIYYLAYHPAQRWYYAPDMHAREAWLIKNYDSASGGTLRVAPHSAFKEPFRGVYVPPRESIEVRAFALFGV
jgi:uncharacterized ParB-like nuclease family protein